MALQSESGRTEQIISRLQLKTLHAILSSRIPHLHSDPDLSSSSSARTRKRSDRWFNLALGDPPPALENPGFFPHGVMDPMIIDIVLSPRDPPNPEPDAVIERWLLLCEPPPPPSSVSGDGSLYRKTYKKSIVLLRSLYSVLRLLPAFKIFRLFSSSTQSYNYDLSFRVSSFAEHFSREEERDLKLYAFTPIETQFGYLSISVTYRPNLSDFNLEVSALMPPMIIADYVGSPAADPMKAFPSSPAFKGSRPISFPSRGAGGSNAPAWPSFQRPHTWTSMPMENHPLSELRSSPTDGYGSRNPVQRSISYKKASFSFDEFRLSPPFSTSPTPSPPAHGSGGSPSQSRPVSIPTTVVGKSQLYRSPNHSDPTRSFLPPPSPRNTRMDASSQESPSSESRSLRKSEGLKLGDFYLNFAQKGLKDGRDDSGRFSGVFSSSGSPRFGFSRSSSRLSIQDDLDDCDFSCPFAVDDVDTPDSQTRNIDAKEMPESSQAYTSSHKSQDAAVGVLIHMLKTAPPLRQDQSYSSQSSRSEVNGEVGSSSYFISRKTSDALEELRSYREMKEILLSQSRTQLLDSVKRTAD